MTETPNTLTDTTTTCTVHTTVETSLRCNKCNRLMCTKCAVRTPVGYRCKECVRGQQDTMFNAEQYDPLIQIAVSAVLSAIASVILGMIGFWWYFTIIGAGIAGVGIANAAHMAVNKRRSRYAWVMVVIGIVLGAVLASLIRGMISYSMMMQQIDPAYIEAGMPLPDMLTYLVYSGFGFKWWIYVIVASISAASQLRYGGRVRFGGGRRFF